MQTVLLILFSVVLIGLLVAALRSARGHREPTLFLANLAEGTHPHTLPHLRSDADITTRHLLMKRGSDANHFAVCGAGDLPLGPCPDEPELESMGAIALLGLVPETLLMIPVENIAIDTEVFTAAGGKIQDTPVAAGTYYSIGYTCIAGVTDVPCEIRHHAPRKLVIAP